MQIYLMRHGEAEPNFNWDGPDNTRPLTKRGREILKKTVGKIKSSDFNPDLVLTSPFIRALQTAEIISTVKEKLNLIQEEELSSGAHANSIRDVIFKHGDSQNILIVGHMPDLALFASRVSHQAYIIEEGLKPGDVLALDAGHIKEKWGTGKILWKKGLTEW